LIAGLAIGWRPRARPLDPRAVVARGAAAKALVEKLLARDDAALAKLSGVTSAASAAGDGLILVLGESAELPWVDGVSYLGRDPAAPSLLLPTASEPDVPVELLERAIVARFAGVAAPIAVLPEAGAIIGVGGARPIVRGVLARFG
jgi:hypothetical protein